MKSLVLGLFWTSLVPRVAFCSRPLEGPATDAAPQSTDGDQTTFPGVVDLLYTPITEEFEGAEPLVTSSSASFLPSGGAQLRPDDAVPLLAFPGGSATPEAPNNFANAISQQAPPQSAPSASVRRPPPPQSPPPKLGNLTSLLQPPPGFQMPPLSSMQPSNIPKLQAMRQGVATIAYQRAVGNFDGVGMNCGLGYLNDYFKDNFVGIPLAMYGQGELCGMCLQLWCVDSICEAPLLNNRTFLIADSCLDCRSPDSLVIAARGAASLSGVNYNINPSLQVAWQPVPCGALITGGIRMLPNEKNSLKFVGLNFSNLKVPLKAVAINGMQMQREPYGSWVIESPQAEIPLKPPYGLQLLSVNGEQLAVKVAALIGQDLGVNFKG